MKNIIILSSLLFISLSSFCQDKFIEVLVYDSIHVQAETLEISIMAMDNNGISKAEEIIDILKSKDLEYRSDEIVTNEHRPQKNASFIIIPKLDITQFKELNQVFKGKALAMSFTSNKEHSRIDEYKKILTSKVLTSAERQAELYATALKVELGNVISITEEPDNGNYSSELSAIPGWHTQYFSKFISGDTNDSSSIILSQTVRVKYSITGK